MNDTVAIDIHDGPGILITHKQWEFLKFIIEDGITFHKACFDDFKTDEELSKEIGLHEIKDRFLQNKQLFQQLTELGINTQNMENYEE